MECSVSAMEAESHRNGIVVGATSNKGDLDTQD